VSTSADNRFAAVCEDDEPFEFDALYRNHGNWLIAFLRRRFGHQDAEDLAQETYLRIASSTAPIRNPRAFLARVALNAARDQIRRRGVRPVLVREDAGPPAVAQASQAEAILLKQAILALPPRLRQVFLLSRFGGLTYEEIARRCGVSVKTVEKRMTKALAMCTALLQ
jgi:RNA polymerase sigma-70 factor (ECF subfamily)